MEENTLTTIAQDMLTEAREASSGRSAHHLNGGREHTLQQTMIALAEGQDLKEHENPGEATIQVITGRVELVAGDESVQLGPAQHAVIPQQRHSLHAHEDSVVLLTLVNKG
ncbi:cupin domain-containing protein [Kocuria marina]|uniref:cupin domain-containing protein n=1 Tax=Kocuria marina TaxID=223184 RepID=UPI0011A65CD6|nr:cupin domain-containing protein [Kocuria indica]